MKQPLFLLLLVTKIGFCQSLSIDETIDYLNKLLAAHPGKGYFANSFDALLNAGSGCEIRVHYKISYDNNGLVSIQELKDRINCPANPKDWTGNGYLYKFNIDDFTEKNVQITVEKKISEVDINGVIGEYEYYKNDGRYSNIGIEIHGFPLHLGNSSYLRVFYHGLKYLVAVAKQNLPKVRDEPVDDPFLTQESSKSGIKQECRVKLLEEDGVFSINVNVGGKIASKFVFDSGAGECNISSGFAQKLIAIGIIKKTDFIESGFYKLADGSIVENRRVKISKLSVGNKSVRNVRVSIGPTDSPNLLGQSFLNKLKQWSIDNDSKQLIIK